MWSHNTKFFIPYEDEIIFCGKTEKIAFNGCVHILLVTYKAIL